MHKLFVLVCVALVFQVTTAEVQPRDLIDEAKNQVELLKSLVQGDILAAHNDLSNFETDFNTYTYNVASSGALSIQEQHWTVISQINTLKELANGAGKDVTTCTDTSEALLDRLSAEYTQSLVNCGNDVIGESTGLLRDAQYIIDVNINKVFNLENQLNRCGNSITCIQPIVTEIQLDMIRLPASIKTEINAVENQLSSVKLSVDQCSNVEVSSYVSAASSILVDVTQCINRILG